MKKRERPKVDIFGKEGNKILQTRFLKSMGTDLVAITHKKKIAQHSMVDYKNKYGLIS